MAQDRLYSEGEWQMRIASGGRLAWWVLVGALVSARATAKVD